VWRRRDGSGRRSRLPLAVGGLTAVGSAAGQLVGVLSGVTAGQVCAVAVAGIITGALAWLAQPDTYKKIPHVRFWKMAEC
jgi:hypothetical protein